jgi:hypothetical protein
VANGKRNTVTLHAFSFSSLVTVKQFVNSKMGVFGCHFDYVFSEYCY